MTHPRREASRVLLIDPADRLLLLRAGGWWFTVSGGLEPGETSEEAAIREVHEETGIRLGTDDLGPVVLEQTAVVPWNGGLVAQHELFRAARVAPTAVTTAGFTPLEQRTIEAARWWTEAELRATGDDVAPAGLPELLSSVTGGARFARAGTAVGTRGRRPEHGTRGRRPEHGARGTRR